MSLSLDRYRSQTITRGRPRRPLARHASRERRARVSLSSLSSVNAIHVGEVVPTAFVVPRASRSRDSPRSRAMNRRESFSLAVLRVVVVARGAARTRVPSRHPTCRRRAIVDRVGGREESRLAEAGDARAGTSSMDASSITTVWCGRDCVRTRSFDSCARAFVCARSFVRSRERRRRRTRSDDGLTRRSLDRFRRGRTPVVRACAPTCARFHRLCVRVRSRANETRRGRLATACSPWAATTAGSRAGSPRARMPGASPRILRPISTAWRASVFRSLAAGAAREDVVVVSPSARRHRSVGRSVGRGAASARIQTKSGRSARARVDATRATRDSARESTRRKNIHPPIHLSASASAYLESSRARAVCRRRAGRCPFRVGAIARVDRLEIYHSTVTVLL